jgi:hypothetical protein
MFPYKLSLPEHYIMSEEYSSSGASTLTNQISSLGAPRTIPLVKVLNLLLQVNKSLITQII